MLIVAQGLLLTRSRAPSHREQNDADYDDARDDKTDSHRAHSISIRDGVDRAVTLTNFSLARAIKPELRAPRAGDPQNWNAAAGKA